jgi:hypothetical protein
VTWYLLDAVGESAVWPAAAALASAGADDAHAVAWRAARAVGGDVADVLADAALYGAGAWAALAAAQPGAVGDRDVVAALTIDVERVVRVVAAVAAPAGRPGGRRPGRALASR